MSRSDSPSVTAVEEILAAAGGSGAPPSGRPRVEHALWLCACVSLDDAPIWLIHDTDDGGVAWCRVPDTVSVDDLVDARLVAGEHLEPDHVLAWLRGDEDLPLSGNGDDPVVVAELEARLRR